jgi:uncharacterized membrane protein YhiD involved in acid resistance
VNQLWTALENSGQAGVALDPELIVMALLMAFVLGQTLAWTYCWTHSGLSYSRSFTQSLVLVTILVAMVMIVVGNNIVTAFGLLGALAIIRFRNVLKDTRDTVFIFSGLVIGLAVGSQRWTAALIGTAAIVLVSFYLSISGFGSRGRFDGFLRYRMANDGPAQAEADRVLHRFCRQAKRVSVRRFGGEPMTDYTWHVRLRDREGVQDLVGQMERVGGVEDVSLVLQEELPEV